MTLARLSDGTQVAIRPIRASDKALLVEGLGRLSEESRRRRFLGPKPRLSATELRYLTEVDGDDHHAVIAVLADRPGFAIGVGRFVRLASDPETAEAAIVVADAYQGKGLGRQLAITLADAARVRGIRRFTASILSDNVPAFRLMRTIASRFEDGGHDHGVRELAVDLAA